jgi:hypothetical protein
MHPKRTDVSSFDFDVITGPVEPRPVAEPLRHRVLDRDAPAKAPDPRPTAPPDPIERAG